MSKLAAILIILGSWSFIFAKTFQVKYEDVKPEFVHYRDTFYKLLDKTCPEKVKYESHYYTITWGKPDKDESWVGICMPSINGYTINIDPDYWAKIDKDERAALMYHELSHCVIYRDHVPDKGNYMYKALNVTDPLTVLSQVKANMVKYCNE